MVKWASGLIQSGSVTVTSGLWFHFSASILATLLPATFHIQTGFPHSGNNGIAVPGLMFSHDTISQETWSVKSKIVNILGCVSLLQPVSSAIVVQKRSQTICEQMCMAVFQQNFNDQFEFHIIFMHYEILFSFGLFFPNHLKMWNHS